MPASRGRVGILRKNKDTAQDETDKTKQKGSINMNKVKILTDSCSDLSVELMQKYDIDYAKMNTVENGVETPASLAWEYYTPHEFFQQMREGKIFKTTAVPAQTFREVFRQYASEGYDVIYIACASKQSGSVNTARVVAEELKPEFPDVSIYPIDAENSSAGEAMLAIRAAELRDAGLDAAAITKEIEGLRCRVREYLVVNTLDYLKRAGRVKASKAFFGNLFGVKPILISDANGTQTPCTKVKGREPSLKKIVELLKDTATDLENQTVYVINADASEKDLNFLLNEIKTQLVCRDVCVLTMGPIVGASVGPDALGVFAFGEPVTYIAQG